ncbi:MAG TPA: hypothetical protein VIP98_03615 [Microlunatus sp.]
MTDVRAEVGAALPLTVEGMDVLDPFVSIYGSGWSLGVNCDWKLSRGDEIAVTSESDEEDITRAFEALIGKAVVDVEVDDGLFDPTFGFDSGERLTVVADTDLDPWVFKAEQFSQTLVGRGPEGHKEWLGQHSV